MLSDHERFKNIAAGIQSFALVLAIAVGGGWTMYTFGALHQAESAKAQLRAQLNQAEMAKAQLRAQLKALKEIRTINIAIKPAQIEVPDDETRYILAMVEITNVGNHPEILEFRGPPFAARRVFFDDRGRLRSDAPTGGVVALSSGEAAAVQVMPKELVRLPCIAKVKSPGLYYLTFSAVASEAQQRDSLAEGTGGPVEWADATCVTVR
jgi:hypothetical protein